MLALFDLSKELAEGIPRADVQIDFRRLQPIMAENLLEAGGADAFLDTIGGEGVP